MSTIQLLYNQSLQCSEGPVWEPQKQRLYWTESAGNQIFVGSKKEAKPNLWKEGVPAASLALHANGGVVTCGSSGLHHIKPGGETKPIEIHSGEMPVHLNEIIADPLGRIFTGQEAFKDNCDYPLGYLYRVDTDNTVSVVDDGLHLGNGMGFSPDYATFYLTDSILRTIYAYDYDIKRGETKNKRIFIQLSQDDGLPDGLTVDKEGYLWIACYFGGKIQRYDPEGKLEREIKLPASQPTSLTFGGKEYNEIFITTAAQDWRSPLAPPHHNYEAHRGGSIYHIVQDIEGRPENCARI